MLDKLANNNTNKLVQQEFKDYMAFFPDINDLITGIITKDLNLAKNSIRVSLSHLTTKEEIDIFLKELTEVINENN